MHKKPFKLSIIIPHFNDYSNLVRLMESIEFNDLTEVIIIDDNSPMHPMEILPNEFKDSVTLIINKKNRGAGFCRNLGLAKSNAEFVLFADSDDYFADDYFRKLSVYFSSQPDITFFKSDSVYVDGVTQAKRHLRNNQILDQYVIKKSKKAEFNLRYRHYVPWSKMYRANFLKRNNIRFDNTEAANDGMFSAKAGYFARSLRVSMYYLYIVTDRKNSVSKRKDLLDIRLSVQFRHALYVLKISNNLTYKYLSTFLFIRFLLRVFIKFKVNKIIKYFKGYYLYEST